MGRVSCLAPALGVALGAFLRSCWKPISQLDLGLPCLGFLILIHISVCRTASFQSTVEAR